MMKCRQFSNTLGPTVTSALLVLWLLGVLAGCGQEIEKKDLSSEAGTSTRSVVEGAELHIPPELAVIYNAYQNSFGRQPGSNEIAYWHPKVLSYEEIMRHLRNYLLNTSDRFAILERQDTIKRAYQDSIQRQPSQSEIDSWKCVLKPNETCKKNVTYQELVMFLRNYFNI